MTPPESVTPRWGHSITATSLGPGLTEVLVFGGRREKWGVEIAETTILRFGEQLLKSICVEFDLHEVVITLSYFIEIQSFIYHWIPC